MPGSGFASKWQKTEHLDVRNRRSGTKIDQASPDLDGRNAPFIFDNKEFMEFNTPWVPENPIQVSVDGKSPESPVNLSDVRYVSESET
jgi:hypothetical protein